ncbi:MAG: RnfABCDGE type electron transport complex subunit D [Candidatus Amulumruptor caecigallinarius]|nr:RnfABCDGE type electron transport complex subunit D [Candidatus Amulumruptor caecigallinarius]MCM1396844.1 RnfABCDGE type electron transport complex subunit D [Candidatus Amulumruptor caecigallinarius]MCM1454212.1 RnfABCDGE type electron transport complex subunit D [bacterium]
MPRLLTISASPHFHCGRTVSFCMWQVTVALIPALAVGIYVFGIGAAIVTVTSVLGCIITEWAITRFMLRRPATIANGSALLTGLLLAMNLPANLPVWTVLIGCVAAIGIGKMAYGGLGCNIFNPALVGRVFLLLSFPALMTTWPLPMVDRGLYPDGATGATILSQLKSGLITPDAINIMDKATGIAGGSLGEVGSLALILGLLYLLAMRIISWHIPVSIIATAALLSWAIGGNPAVEVLSGGLLLGAIFMATDYVTSPLTHWGMIIYGVAIGALTIVIRHWGSYPEGMSFAILIMNGFTPLINRYCRPRRFGTGRAARL